MYRHDFPRIYEIRDALNGLVGAYPLDFENPSKNHSIKREYFRGIEADLELLDEENWKFLKREVVPLPKIKDPSRGWQQAFDKLNQAKA